ncbi:hypothetical protein D3C72_1770970 [compost metagenome]
MELAASRFVLLAVPLAELLQELAELLLSQQLEVLASLVDECNSSQTIERPGWGATPLVEVVLTDAASVAFAEAFATELVASEA